MIAMHPDVNHIPRLLALYPSLEPAHAIRLVEIVSVHRVRWEVWPERRCFDGKIKQIGFEMDLIGDHDGPYHSPTPGGDDCLRVYEALKEVAAFAMPQGDGAARYELDPFDYALHYARGEAFGHVTLQAHILHQGRFDAPPDASEREFLAEIESKLSALGAHAAARHLGSSTE
jgi:hypothetical protein